MSPLIFLSVVDCPVNVVFSSWWIFHVMLFVVGYLSPTACHLLTNERTPALHFMELVVWETTLSVEAASPLSPSPQKHVSKKSNDGQTLFSTKSKIAQIPTA